MAVVGAHKRIDSLRMSHLPAQQIERVFPKIGGTKYAVTSPLTTVYNCIAWAASDDARWWWPTADYYWPDGATREESLAAFAAAFGTLGFQVCSDGLYVEGVEKVAVYAVSGKPTHAARQVGPDRWTSKLGQAWDIEHELHAVENPVYGNVAMFLARSIQPPSPSGSDESQPESARDEPTQATSQPVADDTQPLGSTGVSGGLPID